MMATGSAWPIRPTGRSRAGCRSADGKEIILSNGVHAVTFAYDANHHLVRSTLIGADGNPFNGADG
jgi:hypothetical protein